MASILKTLRKAKEREIKGIETHDPTKIELTVRQSADYLFVTDAAIRFAIRVGRLLSRRDGKYIYITLEQLKNYSASRWSRAKHYKEGEMGIAEASQKYAIPSQHLYYLVHNNKIAYHRKGKNMIILKEKDIVDYVREVEAEAPTQL